MRRMKIKAAPKLPFKVTQGSRGASKEQSSTEQSSTEQPSTEQPTISDSNKKTVLDKKDDTEHNCQNVNELESNQISFHDKCIEKIPLDVDVIENTEETCSRVTDTDFNLEKQNVVNSNGTNSNVKFIESKENSTVGKIHNAECKSEVNNENTLVQSDENKIVTSDNKTEIFPQMIVQSSTIPPENTNTHLVSSNKKQETARRKKIKFTPVFNRIKKENVTSSSEKNNESINKDIIMLSSSVNSKTNVNSNLEQAPSIDDCISIKDTTKMEIPCIESVNENFQTVETNQPNKLNIKENQNQNTDESILRKVPPLPPGTGITRRSKIRTAPTLLTKAKKVKIEKETNVSNVIDENGDKIPKTNIKKEKLTDCSVNVKYESSSNKENNSASKDVEILVRDELNINELENESVSNKSVEIKSKPNINVKRELSPNNELLSCDEEESIFEKVEEDMAKKVFRERKKEYHKKAREGPIEQKKMTMFDLIYYNPQNNPMPGPKKDKKKKNDNDNGENDGDIDEMLREEMVDDLGLDGKDTDNNNLDGKDTDNNNPDGKDTDNKNPDGKDTDNNNPDGKDTEKINPDGKDTENINPEGKDDAHSDELVISEELSKLIKSQEYQEDVKKIDSVNESDCDEDIFGPKLKIGLDGEIIIDEQSLVIKTTAAKEKEMIMSNSILVEENNDESSYGLYNKKRRRSCEWTIKETARFYKALSTVGTDFSLMETIFTWRSRAELKTKFKKEERKCRDLVERALKDDKQFEFTIFDESDYDPEEDKKSVKNEKKKEAKRKKDIKGKIKMREKEKKKEENAERKSIKMREKEKRKEEIAERKGRKKVLRKVFKSKGTENGKENVKRKYTRKKKVISKEDLDSAEEVMTCKKKVKESSNKSKENICKRKRICNIKSKAILSDTSSDEEEINVEEEKEKEIITCNKKLKESVCKRKRTYKRKSRVILSDTASSSNEEEKKEKEVRKSKKRNKESSDKVKENVYKKTRMNTRKSSVIPSDTSSDEGNLVTDGKRPNKVMKCQNPEAEIGNLDIDEIPSNNDIANTSSDNEIGNFDINDEIPSDNDIADISTVDTDINHEIPSNNDIANTSTVVLDQWIEQEINSPMPSKETVDLISEHLLYKDGIDADYIDVNNQDAAELTNNICNKISDNTQKHITDNNSVHENVNIEKNVTHHMKNTQYKEASLISDLTVQNNMKDLSDIVVTDCDLLLDSFNDSKNTKETDCMGITSIIVKENYENTTDSLRTNRLEKTLVENTFNEILTKENSNDCKVHVKEKDIEKTEIDKTDLEKTLKKTTKNKTGTLIEFKGEQTSYFSKEMEGNTTDSLKSNVKKKKNVEDAYNKGFAEEKSSNEKSNIYKTYIKENDTETAAIEKIDLKKTVDKTEKCKEYINKKTNSFNKKIEVNTKECLIPLLYNETEVNITDSLITNRIETHLEENNDNEKIAVEKPNNEKYMFYKTTLNENGKETVLDKIDLQKTIEKSSDDKEDKLNEYKDDKTQTFSKETEINTADSMKSDRIQKASVENADKKEKSLENSINYKSDLYKTHVTENVIEETAKEKTYFEKAVEKTAKNDIEETVIDKIELGKTIEKNSEDKEDKLNEYKDIKTPTFSKEAEINTADSMRSDRIEKASVENDDKKENSVEISKNYNSDVYKTHVKENDIEETAKEKSYFEKAVEKTAKNDIEETVIDKTDLGKTIDKSFEDKDKLNEYKDNKMPTFSKETEINTADSVRSNRIDKTSIENADKEKNAVKKSKSYKSDLYKTHVKENDIEETAKGKTYFEKAVEKTAKDKTEASKGYKGKQIYLSKEKDSNIINNFRSDRLEKNIVENNDNEIFAVEKSNNEKSNVNKTHTNKNAIEKSNLNKAVEKTAIDKTENKKEDKGVKMRSFRKKMKVNTTGSLKSKRTEKKIVENTDNERLAIEKSKIYEEIAIDEFNLRKTVEKTTKENIEKLKEYKSKETLSLNKEIDINCAENLRNNRIERLVENTDNERIADQSYVSKTHVNKVATKETAIDKTNLGKNVENITNDNIEKLKACKGKETPAGSKETEGKTNNQTPFVNCQFQKFPVSAITTNLEGNKHIKVTTKTGCKKDVPVPSLPPGTSSIVVVASTSTLGSVVYHVYAVAPPVVNAS